VIELLTGYGRMVSRNPQMYALMINETKENIHDLQECLQAMNQKPKFLAMIKRVAFVYLFQLQGKTEWVRVCNPPSSVEEALRERVLPI
jgi:prephenate dehydrogenase